MAARSYVIGIPLAVTVDDDGRVTLDVDLTEIADMEPVDFTDTALLADVLTAEEAVGRLGNTLTFTINPIVNPTA